MLSHELTLVAMLCLGADGGTEAAKNTFNDVEAAVAAKTLTRESLQDCTGGDYSEVDVFREATGVIRKLERSNGSADHLETTSSYYDAKGRLRFLFVKAGAVPSAHVEARWWFDERGKVLKHTRDAGGEGPTYFGAELKLYLVKDPNAFLAKRTRCPAGTERP